MHTVNLRHPGYSDECNILLCLQAPEHPDGGVYAETARLACWVLANNRWDGFLSTKKHDASRNKARSGILRGKDYYFHLPDRIPEEYMPRRYVDAREVKTGPYPVTIRFADWSFPAHGLPPIWQPAKAVIEEGAIKFQNELKLNEAEDISLSNVCCLCGGTRRLNSAGCGILMKDGYLNVNAARSL
ncbi:hypothetical protein F5Y16DRAFT_69568 [Xylariaceae sp. FL0255]|nr:hypothetical protein F5Y16DRAFT_69568 [Xylariaceae sp. FL0255]